MALFRRRERISPAFLAVPGEPPDVVASVADVDKRLQLIAITPDRTVYTWALADRLLDKRIALRAARPAPGIGSIIDNDRENP